MLFFALRLHTRQPQAAGVVPAEPKQVLLMSRSVVQAGGPHAAIAAIKIGLLQWDLDQLGAAIRLAALEKTYAGNLCGPKRSMLFLCADLLGYAAGQVGGATSRHAQLFSQVQDLGPWSTSTRQPNALESRSQGVHAVESGSQGVLVRSSANR